MKFSKPWGVQAKILLVFTAINIVATAAYTLFVYQLKTDGIYEAADASLRAAAHAIPRMLPAGYLDQPLQAPPPAQYLEHARALEQYSQWAGLRYVYAFVQESSQSPVRYLADATSDGEISANHYGQFLQTYLKPPPELLQAFRDGQPHVAEYTDQFGPFCSLFVPGLRQDGYPHPPDLTETCHRFMNLSAREWGIGCAMLMTCSPAQVNSADLPKQPVSSTTSSCDGVHNCTELNSQVIWTTLN